MSRISNGVTVLRPLDQISGESQDSRVNARMKLPRPLHEQTETQFSQPPLHFRLSRADRTQHAARTSARLLSCQMMMGRITQHRRATDRFFTSELQATLPTSGFNCQRVESISALQHWKSLPRSTAHSGCQSRNLQWTHHCLLAQTRGQRTTDVL